MCVATVNCLTFANILLAVGTGVFISRTEQFDDRDYLEGLAIADFDAGLVQDVYTWRNKALTMRCEAA